MEWIGVILMGAIVVAGFAAAIWFFQRDYLKAAVRTRRERQGGDQGTDGE